MAQASGLRRHATKLDKFPHVIYESRKKNDLRYITRYICPLPIVRRPVRHKMEKERKEKRKGKERPLSREELA